MADHTYRMSYPIEDDSLRLSQVINQAALVFPEEAEERGFRLLGDPKFWIDEDRVHCEAPAEVIEGRKPKLADLHGWKVVALHAAGKNDREVGLELGLPLRTIQRIRTELGLAPVRKHAKEAA